MTSEDATSNAPMPLQRPLPNPWLHTRLYPTPTYLAASCEGIIAIPVDRTKFWLLIPQIVYAASIDGVAIKETELFTRRELSPIFNVTLPENNNFDVSSGIYGPVVSDGYWLLVAPLTLGERTITFGGTTTTGFLQDNIYVINVTSVPEPMSIVGFLALATLGFGLTLRRKLETIVPERYTG